jgi:hypothetical protein
MTVLKLASIPSAGPKEAGIEYDTGAPVEYSTPCRICDGNIAAGEMIAHDGQTWCHEKCVTSWLANQRAEVAWLVLASQIARRPNSFKSAEIKVIVSQVLRIAGGLPTDEWEED